MNISIVKERLNDKAIEIACQYDDFDKWFEIEIDEPEFFAKANVFVTDLSTSGRGAYPDTPNHSVMMSDIIYEPVVKSRIKILKECMSAKYCGKTRFDFLDPEERVMILKAMEIYKYQG